MVCATMRRRLLSLLILLPILCGSSWEVTGSFELSGSWESGSIGGGFVTLAASSLSGETSFPAWPTSGYTVDTSGWTQRNVTTIGGSGAFSACSNLDNTGTTAIDSDLACMWNALGADEYLYFPNGTYDIDGSNGSTVIDFDENTDSRGIICESRSAILNWTTTYTDTFAFLFEGPDSSETGLYGTTVSWTSGFTEGTTSIDVSSTSGFTTGEYVRLTAQPASDQNGILRTWVTQVTVVDSNTLTLADALLEDFDGSTPEATPLDATEEIVIRNCRFDHEEPWHIATSTHYLRFRNMVGFELTGNYFDGAYREYISTGSYESDSSGDVNISGNVFADPHWDKGPNGYGIVVSGVDRLWFTDNYMQHSTGLAMSGGTNGYVVMFNHFAAPPANAQFDNPCTGGVNNNDCSFDATNHSHATTYSGATALSECTGSQTPHDCCTGSGTGTCVSDTTNYGDAFGHCSTSYNDLRGLNGSASCQGSQLGAVYSCAEWHNASSSQGLFARNYCESGLWFDNAVGGPGLDNVFYGNWFHDATDSGVAAFTASPTPLGGFGWQAGFGPSPSGYRHAHQWINNIIEGDFGDQTNGFDADGDGMFVSDNVIEGACGYTQSSGVPSDLSTQCGTESVDGSNAKAGINVTYQHNTQGADVHSGGYSRTPASLPFLSDWPTFYHSTGSLTAPYVGPEMGDPDTFGGCLPAYYDFNGGSC